MPLHPDRSPYRSFMEHRRRSRARDWFIILLCFIVAMFVGLARRGHLQQDLPPRPEQIEQN